MIIGFSTGCLYQSNLTLNDKIKLYFESGANAIELSFPSIEDVFNFKYFPETIEIIENFQFITIHAPWKLVCYNVKDSLTIKELNDLYKLIKNPQGIVFHPDIINDFQELDKIGSTILLENMDPRKSLGKKSDDFKEIINNYNFKFVLDLFHAYENDSSMQIIDEFINLWGNRISHVHVNGQTTKQRHSQMHIANNQKDIIKGLQLFNGLPIILEGAIKDNFEQNIAKELEFIKSHL